MPQPSRVFVCICAVAVLAGFASPGWGQAVPVYVSGGPFIYVAKGGTTTVIFTSNSASFETLAIAPDNADKDALGNPTHPFLLYACDVLGNTIIRFDPTAAIIVPETLYNGSVAGLTPECGRSTSTGDFFVSNKNAPGVYEFPNVANIAFGTLTPITPTLLSPSPAFPAAMTGRGTTQKNVGDMLVVDNNDKQVLRLPFGDPPFGSQSTLISSANLNNPIGIARLSTGDVFVANSVLSTNSIAHFDRTGAVAAACPNLIFPFGIKSMPFSLTAGEDDTLYATATEDPEDLDFVPGELDFPGQLWRWKRTQGNCIMALAAKANNIIEGVAIGPIPTAPITETLTATVANPTPTNFNFNSSIFQITATGCNATVTAFPVTLSTVNGAIALAHATLPDGATPAVNLGEEGYEIAYVAKWNGCTSVFPDGQFVTSIFGLYDETVVNNPRVVRCDSNAAFLGEPQLDASTTCLSLNTIGNYPLGGLIPLDNGTTVRGASNSAFYLVNANESAAVGTTAQFCGFESPLTNTLDPNQAPIFTVGAKNTLPVKFKLAEAAPVGSCQNGPFISTAIALLSVERIADANGNAVFNPINIESTSAAGGDAQPLFVFGKNQYNFTLTISGLQPGLYAASVLFLSDNTTEQTTLFRLQ